MPGLKGGALTEFDIRARLTEVLQSRGLQGQTLGAKLDETLSKLSKLELAQWASNPTWQGLKQAVGTRVTYISKPKREIDPLTIRDPWLQALHEVWQNEDGSTPFGVGSTPKWIVVWPPIQPPPPGPACENVTFPARLMTETPAVTLLHGQAFQFRAKGISLRQEADTQEFPQRSSVSILVEAYQDEVPSNIWEEILDRPMQVIKRHLEQSTPFLGNWGTRYWSSKGKPARSHEATKFSTNLLVQEDKLDATLQKSGDLLWISPRLDQSAFTRYRPIWIAGTLETARIAHAKLAGACGLVRTRRGFGIRVESSQYDGCRRLLLPDEPQTPHLGRDSELWHYKLSPTPVGATSEDILNFTLGNFPDIKSTVKRQLGPRAWLLSFAAPINKEYLQSKEGFLVLQPWQVGKRHDPLRGAIAVGNPRILKDVVVSSSSSSSTPLRQHVPLAPPGVAPRTAPGPVQELLDAKIKASEDKMKALIEDQRVAAESRHTELRSRLDQFQAVQDLKMTQLEETLQEHRSEAQQVVQELKQTTQDNHCRLERTMSEQFANMLTEISKLTRQESKRTSEPSPEGQPIKIPRGPC